MTAIERPLTRPQNPFFSAGPCTKHPGWSLNNLKDAMLGRSHRSAAGKARLKLAIDRTRALLKLPDDYLVAIVPGSDTGAVEMALWSLLGARGVDILAWEAFGKDWVVDIVGQLKVDDVRVMEAPYGRLPDLAKVDFARDVVFTWKRTISGVRVPNADWIAADRQGLTICDATSGISAQSLDWAKLDVITYSWQKLLGGEAAHGMLILSPRAVERLESHTPKWPVPEIFRLTKGGRLNREIFEGATIKTPSMLCVEDYLDALAWAENIGGLDALIARSNRTQAVTDWVERTPRFSRERGGNALKHIGLLASGGCGDCVASSARAGGVCRKNSPTARAPRRCLRHRRLPRRAARFSTLVWRHRRDQRPAGAVALL